MPARRPRLEATRSPAIDQSVMLVDDHPLWRDTLRKVIERQGIGTVIAEASDGDEAVETALAVCPDLVVMDMALPTMGGAEATRRIRLQHPNVKVLVLSSFEARSSVIDAVRAGASGYLLKTSGAREVADAIRRIAEGELVFPQRLANVVLDEFRRLSDSAPHRGTRAVALVGDSAVHRDGLARVLTESGFDVAAMAGSVSEVIATLAGDETPVWVLDFHGAPDKGLKEATHLRGILPEAKLLVLSQGADSSPAFDFVSTATGGVGFLLRERVTDAEHLADAIRRVAAGESVVDPTLVKSAVRGSRDEEMLSLLTDRERQVLTLMAEGRSNQAICARLHLSNKTLEKHIRAIFTKLGLEDSADAHRRVLAVIAYLRSL